MLQSLERINEARANVILAGAGGLPQINGSGSANAQGSDGSYLRRQSGVSHSETKSLSAGADASWLLDLFGQYRRARESANASLDAAYNDINVARLVYLSDLVTSYVDARYNQEALALAKLSLSSRRETLKLTNDIRAAAPPPASTSSRPKVSSIRHLLNFRLTKPASARRPTTSPRCLACRQTRSPRS